MKVANLVAMILVLVGALNWGLVGIFNWNLVSAIFGETLNIGSRIVYILVFTGFLWIVGVSIAKMGKLNFNPANKAKAEKAN